MTSKKLTPFRRRQLTIERLVKGAVDNKSRQFWKIQMKMLNELEEKYSLEFLEVLTLDFQVDQMASLGHKNFKSKIDRKWRNFNFKVDLSKYTVYDISEKCGKDYESIYNKPKNTKDLFK